MKLAVRMFPKDIKPEAMTIDGGPWRAGTLQPSRLFRFFLTLSINNVYQYQIEFCLD